MENKKKCTAIVLSAGSGKRMGSEIAKQYLPLADKPIICHTLLKFEQSALVDDIVLVIGKGDEEFVLKEILGCGNFTKVKKLVIGGSERYLSVQNAILSICDKTQEEIYNPDGYVLIHDGARPFVTEQIIQNVYEGVAEHGAAVCAVKTKDTIKIVDKEGFAVSTPARESLYSMQTPQGFCVSLIKEAYDKLDEMIKCPQEGLPVITDDAMVVETTTAHRIKIVDGSYENIKITTPEDLEVAKLFLSK